jgi:hypothetical protein
MIPNENQQGFNLPATDEVPRGPVLLVEKQEAHEQFHEDHPNQLTVLLRITHVRRLVHQNRTAESYFGENVRVVTTTTVNDRVLSELDWEKELDLVAQFQPDFHIPCDYPVYKEDEPVLRRKRVLKCLKGTIWMASELYGAKTQVLPLLKGETPHERRLCYQVFDQIGVKYCVFYGTQYFTAGIGFKQLRKDLRTVASEAPDLEIMLIGLQAPDLLEEVPPQIVAAAGQRWIDEVQLREVPWEQSQQLYEPMAQKINAALGQGQMPIMAWANSEVTA